MRNHPTWQIKEMADTGGGVYTSGAFRPPVGPRAATRVMEYYVLARGIRGNVVQSSVGIISVQFCRE